MRFLLLTVCFSLALSRLHDPPDSWDWRSKGIIDSVKNQGEASASVIYSLVDTATSDWALYSGALTPLSMQQVIDCANAGPTPLPTEVGEYIFAYPLESAADYPTSGGNGTCAYDSTKAVAKFQSWRWGSATEDQLKGYVAQQPVSVLITVSDSMLNYT